MYVCLSSARAKNVCMHVCARHNLPPEQDWVTNAMIGPDLMRSCELPVGACLRHVQQFDTLQLEAGAYSWSFAALQRKCELERLDGGIVTLVEFFAAEDAAR